MKKLEEFGISSLPWRAKPYQTVVEEWMVLKSEQIGCPIASSLCEGSARLIAAAPELYEALRGCYITMEWLANHPDKTVSRIAIKHFDNVKAALAKASGEEAK